MPKLEYLLIYIASHNIDILVITETNLSSKTARFFNTKKFGYTGYWTGADDKIKGSGVGILVANHIAKYVYKCDSISVSHYIIKVTLYFKGCYLQVYGIYYPHQI